MATVFGRSRYAFTTAAQVSAPAPYCWLSAHPPAIAATRHRVAMPPDRHIRAARSELGRRRVITCTALTPSRPACQLPVLAPLVAGDDRHDQDGEQDPEEDPEARFDLALEGQLVLVAADAMGHQRHHEHGEDDRDQDER